MKLRIVKRWSLMPQLGDWVYDLEEERDGRWDYLSTYTSAESAEDAAMRFASSKKDGDELVVKEFEL